MTDYCLLTKPIIASSRDTTETKRQVLEHNLRFEALCGERQP